MSFRFKRSHSDFNFYISIYLLFKEFYVNMFEYLHKICLNVLGNFMEYFTFVRNIQYNFKIHILILTHYVTININVFRQCIPLNYNR